MPTFRVTRNRHYTPILFSLLVFRVFEFVNKYSSRLFAYRILRKFYIWYVPPGICPSHSIIFSFMNDDTDIRPLINRLLFMTRTF